jgi:tRNA pseudouridine38-40 synthase
MRIVLGLEYDGTLYAGWQRQPVKASVITVQEIVELAVSGIANHSVSVVCCGRTDAGVHATQQIVHFDTSVIRTIHAWVRGLNALLPKNVSVRWALVADITFHARHSALERRYTYVLYNNTVRPSLLDNRVGWVHRPLLLEPMQHAAQLLIGQHDFSTFRASQCQAHSPIRTLTHCSIEQHGHLFIFNIQANAFLHHMIRNIVGSLVYVGIGKWSVANFSTAFLAKDRCQGAPTFSPDGLYFCGAMYPKHFNIPQPAVLQSLMI